MRDYLLSLAAEQCYRPVWNDIILTEVAYRERERHREFGLSQTKANQMAAALVAQMTKAFDDSLVDGWQQLEGTFGLPDPNDEHVLATAVTAPASAIVTTNLVHFPEHALPVGIQAVSPADFTARIARTMPGQATAALMQMSTRLAKPRMTPIELLDYFDSHYQMNQTTMLLRPWLAG